MRLFHKILPGIVVRISHLMVAQVLFIFAALAIIVLYPGSDAVVQFDAEKVTSIVQSLGKSVITSLEHLDETPEEIPSVISGIVREQSPVRLVSIYRLSEGVGPEVVFDVTSHEAANSIVETSQAQALTPKDREKVHRALLERAGYSVSELSPAGTWVHYYRLDDEQGTPLLLISAIDGKAFTTERLVFTGSLLLVFLVSTLISLLGVYLISNRFQQPFDRLVRGMEKTSDGELHYLVEGTGDKDLKRLADAFNRMSQTLWDDQRKIRSYNRQLAATNLALWQAQQFLATLFDASPSCIIVSDTTEAIILFNRSSTEVFGYEQQEAAGMRVADLYAQTGTIDESGHSDLRSVSGREVICTRKDGRRFPAFTISSPLTMADGTPCAYLHIIRDISESESFREMMVRLDRYYTKGEMAADIAHEINNYLAVLSGNLELLPMALARGDTEKIEAKLSLMNRTVEQIARFSDGLSVSPVDEPRFGKTNVNQLVENVLAFLKPQKRFDNIDLDSDLQKNIPLIEVDAARIQQLLVNLVYNASEALMTQEAARRIRVATMLLQFDSVPAIRIEVWDNGPGVDESRIGILFHKRFTTKRRGQGIGLTSCRQIVDTHGGSISYRYENGAVFTVDLPVDTAATSTTEDDQPSVGERLPG